MNSPLGELILYRTDDGRTEVHLRAAEGTVWMTQGEMAELFDSTKQNISLHVRRILEEGELAADSVVKFDLTTAADVNGATCKNYLQVHQFQRWTNSSLVRARANVHRSTVCF